MDTKQYLSQISRLNRQIQNKLSEISQLRDLSMGIRAISNEERVQTTPNFDKIGTSIAKIDEMERNLDKMIDEYVEKKNVIISSGNIYLKIILPTIFLVWLYIRNRLC